MMTGAPAKTFCAQRQIRALCETLRILCETLCFNGLLTCFEASAAIRTRFIATHKTAIDSFIVGCRLGCGRTVALYLPRAMEPAQARGRFRQDVLGPRLANHYGLVERLDPEPDVVLLPHSALRGPLDRPYRAIRLIRDPRDIWVSGYLCHLHCDEAWCRNSDMDPTPSIQWPQVDFSVYN